MKSPKQVARPTGAGDGDGGRPDDGNLVERAYWERVAAGRGRFGAPRYVRLAQRLLGPGISSRMRSYEDHLLWNVIYPAHLPRVEGLRVIEIGSAPGRHLVRMRESFGYEPYGLERSAEGAAMNREIFASAGIDAQRVIEGDFFDDALTGPLNGRFDIVVSRGFIEHFPDPAPVLDRHLALLAPGGLLVVNIPNMRGANYLQALLLNRSIISLHNREIMQPGRFKALFDPERVEPLFAGYYGTLNVGLFVHAESRAGRLMRRGADAAQALLNLVMRCLLGDRGLETGLLSPKLLFIGRKIAPGGG